MDNFYEQFEGTTASPMYKASKIFIIICSITAALYLFVGQFPLALLSVGGVILFVLYRKNAYIEYEYEFTAGDFQIDKIMNKKKRKKVISFSAREIEMMFPEDSEYGSKYSNMKISLKNCVTDKEKKVYVIVIPRNSQKVMVRFTPDEKMVDLFFRVNPRDVKK